jgi:hypothetical protein
MTKKKSFLLLLIVLIILGPLGAFLLYDEEIGVLHFDNIMISSVQAVPELCGDIDIATLFGVLYVGSQGKPLTTVCGTSMGKAQIQAVRRMESCSKEAIPVLARNLDSPNLVIRENTTYAIGELGGHEYLKNMLHDENKQIRECAAHYVPYGYLEIDDGREQTLEIK